MKTPLSVILEGLRPDDDHERIRLSELDEIFEGKVVVLRRGCQHNAQLTHTNGSIECLSCHKLLKEVKPKWEKEKK